MKHDFPSQTSTSVGGTGPTLAPAHPLGGIARVLFHYVPAFDALRSYSLHDLGADMMAGLTVATVAVPQAMAYAMLAGLPPEYGLYTAVVMTAVGALFDSSRQLINGPTNAISIALLSAVAMFPEDQRIAAVVTFALLVGLIQLGITLLHLGDLTRYVSHAVIVGFTVGAGLLIVLDQFKNLVGLAARGEAHDHFLKRFWLTMTSGNPLHAPTILVGVGTILLVLAIRKFNGWLKSKGARFPIPQHLVAVAFMAALVWACQLDEQGVRIVGHIPASLPRPQAPDVSWDRVQSLAGNAFAVAILGLLEAIAMAKAIAMRTGQKLNINQQCLSESVANIAGSFFQCMPGSGSLTRSTVNQQAGAVSQWSGVFSAIAVAATILLLAPLAGYIPLASLAGLLMLAAFRMVDFRQMVFHLRATRFDALIVIATAAAAIFISIEFCVLIGVFLSFVLYVPRMAWVRCIECHLAADQAVRERLPDDLRCDRMLLYSLEGELSFGTALELQGHLETIEQHAGPDTRLVLLFLKRARDPDASFLGQLSDFHHRLQKRKILLMLCGVREDLFKALHSSRLDTQIPPECILRDAAYPNNNAAAAIDRAYSVLGLDRCPICPRRKEQPAVDSLDYVI